MTVRWTVRSAGDQGAQFAPRIEPRPENVAKQQSIIARDGAADVGALTPRGSPTAWKYSCYASLDTLAPLAPYFHWAQSCKQLVEFAEQTSRSKKQQSVVFASVTRNPLQKREAPQGCFCHLRAVLPWIGVRLSLQIAAQFAGAKCALRTAP